MIIYVLKSYLVLAELLEVGGKLYSVVVAHFFIVLRCETELFVEGHLSFLIRILLILILLENLGLLLTKFHDFIE